MSGQQLDLLRHGQAAPTPSTGPAIPLVHREEVLVHPADDPIADGAVPLQPARALVAADFAAPRTGPIDAALRWAYRMGVPASVLCGPLRGPEPLRLLGTVACPPMGERAAGVALRAGHFLVHGVKAPIKQMDYASPSRLTPPFARALHAFDWLRDLAASGPREQVAPVAERVFDRWLSSNPAPGKGAAWSVEFAGQRLLACLVHGPLILGGEDAKRRFRVLTRLEETARWLDRQTSKADDRLGQIAGWCAIIAAGLLLPDGRPRRLFGEAGLLRVLGELVGDDGGVLSRSPLAQMDAIALLVELKACYAAVDCDPPAAIEALPALLVPPLLALRMGDLGLGSWQGAGATSAHRLAALIDASGVRARPAKDMRHWGYHRLDAGKSVLVMDAAPPPRPRHARHGCASTLAFEFSHGDHRIVVNCGGAGVAGAQVPLRIEQGLRGTAAHSTLVLDEANSTAILIKGQIGKGVEEVDIARSTVTHRGRKAARMEASHNGYAARYGLIHRRSLLLSAEGDELLGEDVLEPSGRRGKRGKIGFAIRFHLGAGIEPGLSDDKRGAGLALPDGSYWQFRLGGDSGAAELAIEESLWVDGQGRPQAIQQLVIEGMTSRSGERFPWLLKKMG